MEKSIDAPQIFGKSKSDIKLIEEAKRVEAVRKAKKKKRGNRLDLFRIGLSNRDSKGSHHNNIRRYKKNKHEKATARRLKEQNRTLSR